MRIPEAVCKEHFQTRTRIETMNRRLADWKVGGTAERNVCAAARVVRFFLTRPEDSGHFPP